MCVWGGGGGDSSSSSSRLPGEPLCPASVSRVNYKSRCDARLIGAAMSALDGGDGAAEATAAAAYGDGKIVTVTGTAAERGRPPLLPPPPLRHEDTVRCCLADADAPVVVVVATTRTQQSSSSSSHDGNNRDNVASTTQTTVLCQSKLRGWAVCDRDVIQNASSNDDVMTRRRSLKMTSSSSQVNGARDESKCQMLSGTEKEAMNSPKLSKSRRDQFSKVFPDIAETEEVIKSYHCAFFRDILLQGFLYITPNWFCFYSKLLGKKCIKIPVSVVTNITKKKTAIIIPNAIRVNTETDKYMFGSLMSRDNTYQLMFDVWQAKRKANIPLEPEKSDVNEDFDAVDASVKTNSASSLIESTKDEFGVSSDASFCSDLESTSQSAEHLQLERPPSASRASQKDTAAVDLEEDPKEAIYRFSSAESPSFGVKTDKSSHGVRSKTLCDTVNDLVTWVLNLPRTCLFLTISTVLVLFLLLSAMLLAYKLIHLQMQLAANVGWSYRGDDFTELGSEPYREVLQNAYATGHRFHVSNVEKIHLILESHVEVLNKVNQVLKELQRLSVNGCSTVSQGVDGS